MAGKKVDGGVGRGPDGRFQSRKPAEPVLAPDAPLAERRALFLRVLSETANVSRAARTAGLSSSTVYRHRAQNGTFRQDWDAALNEALDLLEEVLIERARDGVEKPVFYGGEVKGTIRVYSDQLAMFLLKAKRPEVYDRMTGVPAAGDMGDRDAKAELMRRIEKVRAAAERDI